MGYAAVIFFVITAYVSGLLIQSILRDNDGRMYKTCLIGTFFLFIVWEAEALISDNLYNSFEVTCRIFSCTLIILFVVSLFVNGRRITSLIKNSKAISLYLWLAVGICVIIELVVYRVVTPDSMGDSIMETVKTVTESDSMFDINPLTGDGYAVGELNSWTDKLGNIGFLYAYMAELFEESNIYEFVYVCMPMLLIVMEYSVFALWSDGLYADSDSRKEKAVYFIGGVTLLNLCGGFSHSSMFYYVTYRGYTGESILYAAVIPFIIFECLSGYKKNVVASLFYILLAGASACILVGIKEGLTTFLIVSFMCFVIIVFSKIGRYIRWHR